jgi:ABC-type iron transport system FetAB permease component
MVAETSERVVAIEGGAGTGALPAPIERGFTFAILLSALRCTVQYVVLPFVLPWIGVVAEVPAWVTLALSGLALFSLVRSVRTLWRMRYARRWSYLALAVIIFAALTLFVFMDLRTMLS